CDQTIVVVIGGAEFSAPQAGFTCLTLATTNGKVLYTFLRSDRRSGLLMTGVKFPQYTLRERIADGCIHVVGVAASVVALTALLVVGVQAQATLWIVSLSIYGLALVTMFTCSAGYNLIVRPKVKAVFRRLDHAAIFLMIAGTYTPFALMKMDAE